MGLFDLFRRRAPEPLPEARPQPPPAGGTGHRRVGNDSAGACDQAQTTALAGLFAVPREQRGPEWLDRYWQNAWRAAIVVADPPIATGPDGFPYMRLHLAPDGSGQPETCLMNTAAEAIEQGAGAALFARPGADMTEAEYVMPLGVLDSLLRFGCPEGDPADLDEMGAGQATGTGATTLGAGEQILVATPSPDFLSRAAARALHRHLAEDWGLADPRVAILVSHALRPSRSLVIGVPRSELIAMGATDDQIAGWMQRIRWFLPPSRGLMLMPDGWSATEMTRLSELF